MKLRQECLRGVIPSSRGSSLPQFVLRVSYASSLFFFPARHISLVLGVSRTICEGNTLSCWAWKLNACHIGPVTASQIDRIVCHGISAVFHASSVDPCVVHLFVFPMQCPKCILFSGLL